MLENIPFRN